MTSPQQGPTSPEEPLALPGEREADLPPGRRAGPPQARPDPLGGSLAVPGERGADLPPLPDRLSVNPTSAHHVAAVFAHDVGIRLNGQERFDVEEYCLSEGWVKVPAGRTLDRKGKPVLIKLKGQVEAFYR